MLEYVVTRFSTGGNSISGFELCEYFKSLTDLSTNSTIFPLVQQENGFCCNLKIFSVNYWNIMS